MTCVAGVFPTLLLQQPTYQLRAPVLFAEAAVQQLFDLTNGTNGGDAGTQLHELVGALVATLRSHPDLLPSLAREHALATRLADSIARCGGAAPLALACFQLLRAAVTERSFGARFAVLFMTEGRSSGGGSWLAAWSLVLERLSQHDGASNGTMLCLMTLRRPHQLLQSNDLQPPRKSKCH